MPEIQAPRKLCTIIESPYGAPTSTMIDANVRYARACVLDSLLKGEAPIASHLLHTQPGILRDEVPEERKMGIDAGHAWILFAHQVVVYTDRGISPGMQQGIDRARFMGVPVVYRSLEQPGDAAQHGAHGLTARSHPRPAALLRRPAPTQGGPPWPSTTTTT